MKQFKTNLEKEDAPKKGTLHKQSNSLIGLFCKKNLSNIDYLMNSKDKESIDINELKKR